jgi:PIN domain nuclease of toxin-antitoxin system
MNDLLLDTCAVLWLAQGAKISAEARRAIAEKELRVSPISAWEIANLVRKNRIALTYPVTTWFRRAIDEMQAAMPHLTIEILANSCDLPGAPPDDPADRIMIATARETDMILVTRDTQILAYSRTGYVRAMAC